MNYKYFMDVYIKPYLSEDDKPFNRQLFHDTKDMSHKDKLITDWQVQNWVYPNTRRFV